MRERETEQGRETAAQVARNEELELTELHPPSTMAETDCNYSRVQLPQRFTGSTPLQWQQRGDFGEEGKERGKKKARKERCGLKNR